MKKEVFTFNIELPGQTLPCQIRYSDRATVMRLRILPDGKPEIVAPRGVSLSTMQKFAFQNQSWLLRTISRVDAQQKRKIPARAFPESISLDYLGGDFAIHYEWRQVSWIAARCEVDEKIIFLTGACLTTEAVYRALGDLLKRLAVEFIFPNMERLAHSFGFHPGKLSIRLQKGRWGSCSNRGGAISLNAFLMMMEEDVVEYILIHELCHLKEMNHSEAFWKEVSRYCPDWQKRRKKLRKLEKERSGIFEQIHQNC